MTYFINVKKYCLYLLLLNCFFFSAFSQNVVQVTPYVTASNSTLLSDYYHARQNSFSVMLRNVDYNKPMVQVYLRITIEGQGVKLKNGSYAIFPAVDLMQGNLVNLGPSELAVYFKPENLQGSIGFGVNQPNVFPEGFYEICIEVLEKNTNRILGNAECVQANFMFSEPVELSLPENRKSISLTTPQNIKFQWSPKHRNVINSTYTFTLVEMEVDEKVTPSTFAKSKMVHTTRLEETKLLYDEHLPALLKGKKYAWKVQTTASTDTGEQEPFQNEGNSDVYSFVLK